MSAQCTFTAAADLFGVSYPRLCRAYKRLPQFPAPVARQHGLLLFDQRMLQLYAINYPVKNLVDEIIKNGRYRRRYPGLTRWPCNF